MWETIVIAISPVIAALAGKYGVAAQVIMVIGTLRLCMKPIMAALSEVVQITPTQKDNELLGKVLANPVYKTICFALDWICSLRLPKA